MKVTVLMPVYNTEAYVAAAIRSILAQSYTDFEFLIIDHSSTDNSAAVIEQFTDPRIRIESFGRSTLGEVLNYGLKLAGSELIIRMDADDISHPDRIKTILATKSIRPDATVISSRAAYFSDKHILYLLNLPEHDSAIKKMLPLHSPVNHGGALFEKSVILNAGGFRDGSFEDYELWLRLAHRITFYNIPEYLYYIRVNADSISRGSVKEKLNEVYQIQAPYFITFSEAFPGFSNDEEMKIRGWREYFYGDKSSISRYWENCPLDMRMQIALLLAKLPEDLFIKFKENRFRLRWSYISRYFIEENRLLRKSFRQYVEQYSSE